MSISFTILSLFGQAFFVERRLYQHPSVIFRLFQLRTDSASETLQRLRVLVSSALPPLSHLPAMEWLNYHLYAV